MKLNPALSGSATFSIDVQRTFDLRDVQPMTRRMKRTNHRQVKLNPVLGGSSLFCCSAVQRVSTTNSGALALYRNSDEIRVSSPRLFSHKSPERFESSVVVLFRCSWEYIFSIITVFLVRIQTHRCICEHRPCGRSFNFCQLPVKVTFSILFVFIDRSPTEGRTNHCLLTVSQANWIFLVSQFFHQTSRHGLRGHTYKFDLSRFYAPTA